MRRAPARILPPAVVAAGLTAVLLCGCGSGGASQTVAAGAASQMRGHLAALRVAAAAHDPAGAGRQLDAFAAEIGREHAAGRLRPADYAALRTAIARTRARIAVDVVAPTSASPVTVAPTAGSAPAPAPAPVPAVDTSGNGKGKGKDQGKGGGHGNGNGGGGD